MTEKQFTKVLLKAFKSVTHNSASKKQFTQKLKAFELGLGEIARHIVKKQRESLSK